MTKGKLIACTVHVSGVLLALLITWIIPARYVEGYPMARPILSAILFVWGCYKLYQILQGRDALGKKTETHFNQTPGSKK